MIFPYCKDCNSEDICLTRELIGTHDAYKNIAKVGRVDQLFCLGYERKWWKFWKPKVVK